MAVPLRSGLFGAIEQELAGKVLEPELRLDEGADGARPPLSLAEARRVLYDRSADPSVQTALWHRIAALARNDGDRCGWRLGAVWMALPGLRRTASRIAFRFGSDRADVEAELVTGFLEALRDIGPETTSPGAVLLRFACTQAWNTARKARAEVAVEDMDAVMGSRHRSGASWQAEFDGPGRPDGLTASLRISIPAERVEGLRIGALAQEWGLADTVTDTQRLRRGRRVGALSLRHIGRRG
ncbi:hypothetical protein ACWCO0_26930 [Streptomyces tubercidicus]